MLIMLTSASAFAEPWKFGIMCDTQWPNSPDGKNPNVAVNVINHLNQEFINHGVKFVVQTGDLTDNGSNNSLDIRATFAQDLYNAGIGFYPLRGNHESSKTAAIEFQRIFPQTQTGMNNQTPLDALITTTYYGAPLANTNTAFGAGGNFASEPGFDGLTYSFDYNNVRIVMLDQFTAPSGASHSNLSSTDVDWVGTKLSSRPAGTHAFVFGHKHLISENHADNLFGSNPGITSTFPLQNSFMNYLQQNGVRYYIGGHDHMHNRAIVTSPDGSSKVQNIILASDSYKFYIPQSTTNDYRYNNQNGTGPAAGNMYPRETQIAQELFTVGYYIVTVDGPKVTVDYYASPNGCNGDCDETYDVIPYTFTKHETFGYSLNGNEYLIAQGQSYTGVDETYGTTKARILSGTNGSTSTDFNSRPLTKTVDTGWTDRTAETASDILTLWGMTDSLSTNFSDAANPNYNYKYVVPSEQTDVYTLSMTYQDERSNGFHLGNGGYRLASKDAGGRWIEAVDLNAGNSKKKFVIGQWNSGYGLGTYGVDPSTHTAWAVVNYNGDFAVVKFE